MKTTATSNWRPLSRALYAFLIVIAALSAMPRNAQAQLYVTQLPSFPSFVGIVSEYNATTGEVIKRDFIRGPDGPYGLAVSDDTLFVLNQGSGTVGTYDATTGAAINTSFITGLTFTVGIAVK